MAVLQPPTSSDSSIIQTLAPTSVPLPSSSTATVPLTRIIAQFVSSEDGEKKGPQLEMSLDTTTAQLSELVNKLLENVDVFCEKLLSVLGRNSALRFLCERHRSQRESPAR